MLFASDEEEQRFAHALLASVLVHVLILGYAKGVEPLRKSGAGGTLHVSFRAVSVVPGPLDAALPPAPVSTQATLTPPLSQSAIRPPPVAQGVQANSTRPVPARPALPASLDRNQTGPPRASSQRGPGVVDVTMLIGADGHPQTLIWDVLPALTKAQFEQLEAIIKRQAYASTTGARLTQEIDVFGLLGIGRRPSVAVPALEDGASPTPR